MTFVLPGNDQLMGGFFLAQVCRVDVPERVCHATCGPTWGQAVLQTVHQHSAAGPRRPSHEGQRALMFVSVGHRNLTRSAPLV